MTYRTHTKYDLQDSNMCGTHYVVYRLVEASVLTEDEQDDE